MQQRVPRLQEVRRRAIVSAGPASNPVYGSRESEIPATSGSLLRILDTVIPLNFNFYGTCLLL